MAKGPGQRRAGIWILERPLKAARHARQKKKLVWMFLMFDFDVLRTMCLKKQENITSQSGWMQNQPESRILQPRRKRKRSAGMHGMRCLTRFFSLSRTWSKRIAIHPNKLKPREGRSFTRLKRHDHFLRYSPSSLYSRPH